MSCREILASEFQWKNFGFTGVSRDKFYLWQWRVPPILIVIYKILMSAYLISTLLYNFLTFESDIPWPVYFTNWTYTLLTTYHVVHTVVVLDHVRSSTCHTYLSRPSREEHHRHFQELMEKPNPAEGTQPIVPSQQTNDHLPLHLILLWIFYTVLNSLCPIVTGWWYGGFATLDEMLHPEELFVHALNTVVVLVDQMVFAIPVRLYHFYFPAAYALVYYLFSILYWMADHKRVVYGKVSDWNHPALPFGLITANCCLAVAFHGLSYIIYRTRLTIYHRLKRNDSCV